MKVYKAVLPDATFEPDRIAAIAECTSSLYLLSGAFIELNPGETRAVRFAKGLDKAKKRNGGNIPAGVSEIVAVIEAEIKAIALVITVICYVTAI